MSVYRKRTLRQNYDCFIVNGTDFNFDEIVNFDLYFEEFGSTTTMFIKSFRRDVYFI